MEIRRSAGARFVDRWIAREPRLYFRGDCDLADLLPAADDLGGCGSMAAYVATRKPSPSCREGRSPSAAKNFCARNGRVQLIAQRSVLSL